MCAMCSRRVSDDNNKSLRNDLQIELVIWFSRLFLENSRVLMFIEYDRDFLYDLQLR